PAGERGHGRLPGVVLREAGQGGQEGPAPDLGQRLLARQPRGARLAPRPQSRGEAQRRGRAHNRLLPAHEEPLAERHRAQVGAGSSVILAGIGGSKGSTTASITTGPGVARASSRTRPQSAGSSIVKPVPPQARAKRAKSIGWRSQPYSGLPRKTICSHLIMP